MSLMVPQKVLSTPLPNYCARENVFQREVGYLKAGVDRLINKAAVAGTIEEVGENVVKLGKGLNESVSPPESIKRVIKSAPSRAPNSLFNKIFNCITLPFTLLSGIVSAYLLGSDAYAATKAYKAKDYESLKERSFSLVSNAGSVTNSGVGGAAGIYKLESVFSPSIEVSKSASAQAAVLGPVSAGLGFGVYALFSTIEAFAVRRIQKTIAAVKRIFTPLTAAEKEGREIERYKKAMQDIVDRMTLSDSEREKIKGETKDHSFGARYLKKRNQLLERKRKALERRIGGKASREMHLKAQRLRLLLDSDNRQTRAQAILESEALFKVYKGALYKKMTLHSLRVGAGVLGLIGSTVAFCNPVGAVAASGAFLGASLVVLLTSYAGGRYWKTRSFEKGFSIGQKVLSNYEIPSAQQVLEQEELECAREEKDPEVLLKFIKKRKAEGKEIESSLYERLGSLFREKTRLICDQVRAAA